MFCLDSVTSRDWEWGKRGGVDMASERFHKKLKETLSNSSVSNVIIVFIADSLLLSKKK